MDSEEDSGDVQIFGPPQAPIHLTIQPYENLILHLRPRGRCDLGHNVRRELCHERAMETHRKNTTPAQFRDAVLQSFAI